MITRRATAVTKSSIKALSKVCYRITDANSIKVGPFGKSLSTATEAYPLYQNPVGNDRNDSNPGQDTSLNSAQFNRNPVGYGGGRVDSFEEKWKVSYGGNRDKSNGSVSRSDNFEAKNTVDRHGQNGDGYNGGGGQISNRNVGQNWHNSNGHGVGDYQQNWDGYKWSNAKEPPQHFREQPGKLNGGNGDYCQSRDVNYKGGHGGVQSENEGVYNRDGANVTNHKTNGQGMSSEINGSMSNFGQHQPADNNNYALSNFRQFQPADNNNYARSNYGQHLPADNNNYAQSNYGQHLPADNNTYAPSNFGQHQPALNSNYAPSNFGQYQPAYNNNYPSSSFGKHQQEDNNNYASSMGAYERTSAQHNGNVGSQTANSYQYQRPIVAGFQQNPYGNLIYNRNAVASPNTSSQVPGYSNTEMNLTDALETQQIRGTIEELEQYTKDGKLKEAMEVLELMEKNQLRLIPERDLSTVVMLIEACGEAEAGKEAKILHKALVKLMPPFTISICNKILIMYLKCGSIEEAYSVFSEIRNDDLTSWNTMITGLVKNDLGEEAIDIFTEFKDTELKPDGQMFLGVFSACGIVGDVTEGMLHFQSMIKQYGIMPSMQHYVGVVEMLGHTGYLDNALEFIENMPVKPSVEVWETLMHVSRIQGNVELGDRCAELVEKLDPSRLSEQSKAGLIPLKASDLEKDKEKKKLASKNLLEVRSRVHEYRAGDTSHPENERIYALLRGLKTQMKEAGYIPELRGVLHDIDPEGKEEALLAHSERLAAAYGFLTTAARQPIRVIKNLRVCVDCHNALKIISTLVGRELIMRDAKRFHHFKDGVCSCKDYW
ncbi:unnamed protein product [Rhodiola kirilowii]